MSSEHFNGVKWLPCSAAKKCRFEKNRNSPAALAAAAKRTVDEALGVKQTSSHSAAVRKVSASDAVWQVAELKVRDRLAGLLEPDGFTVVKGGDHDSKGFDGEIFLGDESMGSYEVKKLPSIAGVQAVMKLNDAGSFYVDDASPFKVTSAKVMNLVDGLGLVDYSATDEGLKAKTVTIGLDGGPHSSGSSESFCAECADCKVCSGKGRCKDCRECKSWREVSEQAYVAFEQKYSAGAVILFAGVPSIDGNNVQLIAVPPHSEEFRKYFIPEVEVRNKPSGSGAPSRALRAEVLKRLAGLGGAEEVVEVSGGKTKVRTMFKGDDRVAASKALAELDGNLLINKSGEVRRSSDTKSLTFLLRLKLAESVPEGFSTSDEDLRQIVLDVRDGLELSKQEALQASEASSANSEPGTRFEASDDSWGDSGAAERYARGEEFIEDVDGGFLDPDSLFDDSF